jgi:arylsulfatase A-like enzyme
MRQISRLRPWWVVGGGLIVALAALWAPSCSSKAISSGNKKPAPSAGPPRPSPTAPRVGALAGPHHPVFSLFDNRLLAHRVQEGGLLVPAGHPGLAKYVNCNRPWGTWRLNVKEDSRRVALAVRNVSWLVVPLTEEQARATTTLTLSLKSPKAQGLIVKLNATKLTPAKLNTGWQKVSLAVPGKALWSGENRIELSWGATGRIGQEKASAALEWAHLGQRAPTEVALLPAQGSKLMLPAGGGLAYYVHPYGGAKLKVRFKGQGGRCDLKLRLAAQGVRAQEMTRPEAGDGKETEAVFDLAPIVERVGRMELLAEGGQCKGLALSEAAIVMPGPELKVRRPKTPKHVLFWMIDNARADRFSLYNPSTRVKTPVISDLGKSGVVFTRAYIQGNESRVSHASIWTGLYPKQHRFIDPKAKLSLEWVTMPKAVKKGGRLTAAVIANGFVSKFWGFGEGWNVFRNTLHQGGGLTAEALANWAIEFINKQSDAKPFFLYVGTIDPHVSWRGRQPWLKEYHPEPYKGPYEKNVFGKDVEKMAAGARPTTPADRKRIIAIYDSTVSYNDQQLGRVLQALKDKGLRDDTMVVVTADHGEELWDYGKVGHGCSVKQELVAVPLIIHYPPLFGHARVREGVDVLSAMATILDAIGAPIPDTVQGQSLLPLAQGVGAGYPRPSFASQYELAHAMRLERWKMRIGGKGEAEIFDLESKQGEHRGVSVNHPLETRWLTDALSMFLTYQDRWRQSRWGVPSNQTAAIAEDLETGGGPGSIRVGK